MKILYNLFFNLDGNGFQVLIGSGYAWRGSLPSQIRHNNMDERTDSNGRYKKEIKSETSLLNFYSYIGFQKMPPEVDLSL